MAVLAVLYLYLYLSASIIVLGIAGPLLGRDFIGEKAAAPTFPGFVLRLLLWPLPPLAGLANMLRRPTGPKKEPRLR